MQILYQFIWKNENVFLVFFFLFTLDHFTQRFATQIFYIIFISFQFAIFIKQEMENRLIECGYEWVSESEYIICLCVCRWLLSLIISFSSLCNPDYYSFHFVSLTFLLQNAKYHTKIFVTVWVYYCFIFHVIIVVCSLCERKMCERFFFVSIVDVHTENRWLIKSDR